MWLPTQAQVNTAGRYATAAVGTAITIFGLQAKGFTLDQAKDLIGALGSTVNSAIILISTAASIYAAIKGVRSSSPTGQAASIGASPSTIVHPTIGGGATVTITDPAMASAAIAAQKTTS